MVLGLIAIPLADGLLLWGNLVSKSPRIGGVRGRTPASAIAPPATEKRRDSDPLAVRESGVPAVLEPAPPDNVPPPPVPLLTQTGHEQLNLDV